MSVDVGSGQTKSEPNVVPLCDILLVLLIIFMVITPTLQRGIDVKLPETVNPTEPGALQSTAIILTLENDLSLKINQEPIDINILESRLRDLYAARTDKTIFIRADEKVNYRDVLRVIDICKGSGIEVLGVIPEHYRSVQ